MLMCGVMVAPKGYLSCLDTLIAEDVGDTFFFFTGGTTCEFESDTISTSVIVLPYVGAGTLPITVSNLGFEPKWDGLDVSSFTGTESGSD